MEIEIEDDVVMLLELELPLPAIYVRAEMLQEFKELQLFKEQQGII